MSEVTIRQLHSTCSHLNNLFVIIKGPDARELRSVKMTIELLDWDKGNKLYFTVTSYMIGKEDVRECEGYRLYST